MNIYKELRKTIGFILVFDVVNRDFWSVPTMRQQGNAFSSQCQSFDVAEKMLVLIIAVVKIDSKATHGTIMAMAIDQGPNFDVTTALCVGPRTTWGTSLCWFPPVRLQNAVVLLQLAASKQCRVSTLARISQLRTI